MIAARIKDVKTQRAAVEGELAQLQHQLAGVRYVLENAPVLRDVVAQVAGRLDTAGFDHKRLALDALKVKVKVWRDRVGSTARCRSQGSDRAGRQIRRRAAQI